jgi:tRNA threonylcarbamoyladenosine biosynthesis protein TsaB
MLTLALETSGFGGSLALFRDSELLGERILDSQRRHAQTLIPEIQALLRAHGQQAADCQLLAVSCGPGSFTGLRVGITCAKTLAYATGAQVAAVPTFPCIAAACRENISRVQVILNAQREELFIGSYSKSPTGKWVESQPLRIERVSKWLEELQPEDVVTGPGVEPIAVEISAKCHVLDQQYWQPRAEWVGRVGLDQIAAGHSTTCWDLEPYYVRKSAAEEKWDAKAAAG